MNLSNQISRIVDVAEVSAAHPVGFSLHTRGETQYVSFYDVDHHMTIGERNVRDTVWRFVQLPETVGWDSHNNVIITTDTTGNIHVSGNMHGDPLVYFRTSIPGDIETFERIQSMIGTEEGSVTYPEFFRGADKRLIYGYRDGYSGRGNQIYNVYDDKTRTWSRLMEKPLFDGAGVRNAYITGPTFGPDGMFHVAWVWRESPHAETNHDPSYARSSDLVHWERSDGTPYTLPINNATGEVIDHIPVGGGVINGNVRIGFDSQHRAIVSYQKYDASGNVQIYNARTSANGVWTCYQASTWNWRWEFNGLGTIPFEIKMHPVKLQADGRLTQVYETKNHGSGTWELDEETLSVKKQLDDVTEFPLEVTKVKSTFPRVIVNLISNTGDGFERSLTHILRWETLEPNRDHAQPDPVPPPTMLQVYELDCTQLS